MSRKTYCLAAIFIAVGAPLVLTSVALAAPAGVSNVENFIRSVIQVVARLAGLVATGFFVASGFTYITSSGSPEQLNKAKRTLAIVIAAFVLANIVTTLARQAFGG